MKLGAALPLTDIGGDPAIVRDFAQAAEGLGYDHLTATDHVLGANVASRPDWGDRNTSADYFHDPFVLFGFLAGQTQRIGFTTQVLVLAQRQTALVAKQAACVDVLSGGRLRLGVGIGWNPVEFTALNENFRDRGRRSEEQVDVLQRLWAEDHVTFEGTWHRIEDAGIRPRPAAGRIPLWFGGHEDVTLERIARMGDGWIMLAWPPGAESDAVFARLREKVAAAGRPVDAVGIEVWTSAAGTPENWRETIEAWKRAGVSHVTMNNTYARGYHERLEGRSMAAHLEALERYRAAVADLLD